MRGGVSWRQAPVGRTFVAISWWRVERCYLCGLEQKERKKNVNFLKPTITIDTDPEINNKFYARWLIDVGGGSLHKCFAWSPNYAKYIIILCLWFIRRASHLPSIARLIASVTILIYGCSQLSHDHINTHHSLCNMMANDLLTSLRLTLFNYYATPAYIQHDFVYIAKSP